MAPRQRPGGRAAAGTAAGIAALQEAAERDLGRGLSVGLWLAGLPWTILAVAALWILAPDARAWWPALSAAVLAGFWWRRLVAVRRERRRMPSILGDFVGAEDAVRTWCALSNDARQQPSGRWLQSWLDTRCPDRPWPQRWHRGPSRTAILAVLVALLLGLGHLLGTGASGSVRRVANLGGDGAGDGAGGSGNSAQLSAGDGPGTLPVPTPGDQAGDTQGASGQTGESGAQQGEPEQDGSGQGGPGPDAGEEPSSGDDQQPDGSTTADQPPADPPQQEPRTPATQQPEPEPPETEPQAPEQPEMPGNDTLPEPVPKGGNQAPDTQPPWGGNPIPELPGYDVLRAPAFLDDGPSREQMAPVWDVEVEPGAGEGVDGTGRSGPQPGGGGVGAADRLGPQDPALPPDDFQAAWEQALRQLRLPPGERAILDRYTRSLQALAAQQAERNQPGGDSGRAGR